MTSIARRDYIATEILKQLIHEEYPRNDLAYSPKQNGFLRNSKHLGARKQIILASVIFADGLIRELDIMRDDHE